MDKSAPRSRSCVLGTARSLNPLPFQATHIYCEQSLSTLQTLSYFPFNSPRTSFYPAPCLLHCILLYSYLVAPHLYCLHMVRTPLHLSSYHLPPIYTTILRLSVLLKASQHMTNAPLVLSILIIHPSVLSNPHCPTPRHGQHDIDFSFYFSRLRFLICT
jgi:hypothetical protein